MLPDELLEPLEESLEDEPLAEEPPEEEPLEEEPLEDESDDDGVSDPATFFLFPDLKSVSYQPPPLSLNPAAEIFFRKLSSLHSGHTVSRPSLKV